MKTTDKTTDNTRCGNCDPIHCWGECKLVDSLEVSLMESTKAEHILPYDPAALSLGVYPAEMCTDIHQTMCTRMSAEALCTTAKCPSTATWITKVPPTRMMKYYAARRTNFSYMQ